MVWIQWILHRFVLSTSNIFMFYMVCEWPLSQNREAPRHLGVMRQKYRFNMRWQAYRASRSWQILPVARYCRVCFDGAAIENMRGHSLMTLRDVTMGNRKIVTSSANLVYMESELSFWKGIMVRMMYLLHIDEVFDALDYLSSQKEICEK